MPPDDLQELEDVFLKKVKSYLGKIPSEDFDPEQYAVFLEIASPEELEEDIITRQTLHKIITPDYSKWEVMKTDKLIDPEDPACWNYSEARLMRMK